jgi:hypothetical protein
MINLHNVTLVAVSSVKIQETVDAINYSSRGIKFYDKLLITHRDINNFPKKKTKIIEKINSIKEWCRFILFDLHNFIETDFILLIHWDGFVINPEKWSKEFLRYDYIGSPWPNFKKILPQLVKQYSDNKYRVGNSVSIRSKKLLQIPSQVKLNWNDDGAIANFHEDGYLCVHKREELEKYGIKFAPFDLACKFGREYTFEENRDIKPFIFHKWYAENKKFPTLSHKFTLKEKIKRFINFGYY